MTIALIVLSIVAVAQMVLRHLEGRSRDAHIRELAALHAADLRSLIERVEQAPQLVIREAVPSATPNTDEKSYISEFEYDDKAWNDYVGVEVEDEA